jgi:hypothetical protein
MEAVVDLEEGLPLEVEISPESSAGNLTGSVKGMDVEQHFTADVVLTVDASGLLSCLMRHLSQPPSPANATAAPERRSREPEGKSNLAAIDPSTKPSKEDDPPSYSSLLPRV